MKVSRVVQAEAVRLARALGYKPCQCGPCHVTADYRRHVRAFVRAITFGRQLTTKEIR